MKTREDLSGRRFGRWTVIGTAPKLGKKIRWLCRCECGTRREVHATHLRSGRSQSCGCLTSEVTTRRVRKHGHSFGGPLYSKEYRTWQAMKRRCDWPKHKDYQSYGGRGIHVADEWLKDFMVFYDHIGPAPSAQHLIDRIDVNGHYEPGNVRWVTPLESRHNRRDTVR